MIATCEDDVGLGVSSECCDISGKFHRKEYLMLLHIAESTLQVANLVKYNYHLQEDGNLRRWRCIGCFILILWQHEYLMLHHIASATIQVANLVNFNCYQLLSSRGLW